VILCFTICRSLIWTVIVACHQQLSAIGMYHCRVCTFSTSSLKCYVSHYRIHGTTSNFRLPCGITSCGRTFTTFTAFNAHSSQDTTVKCKSMSDSRYKNMDVMLQCTAPFCAKQFTDLQTLLRHLKVHTDSTERIACPFRDCDILMH
jgi:uncharacterized Zn-finger protein